MLLLAFIQMVTCKGLSGTWKELVINCNWHNINPPPPQWNVGGGAGLIDSALDSVKAVLNNAPAGLIMLRSSWARHFTLTCTRGNRSGTVVIALASHQYGPGSNRGPSAISWLSLWFGLVLVPRIFLRVLQFSSLHKNQLSKFQFDWELESHT